MPSKGTIISVKNIYKSFITGDRYTKVLKNVSLDIQKGEFLIVFGPSGCGKSTLLHVAMGLERPDSGTIKFGGMNLWELNTKDRANVRKRQIGIMYQKQNWINSLTVEENIAFSGQLTGLEKDESLTKGHELLRLVGMQSRSKYVPSELSAGEQQKIGLSRALMTNPPVIIADEPTGNLDVKSGQEMMNLLTSLKNGGKTIIMVTHNPEYLKFADRVVLMLDGQIRREIIIKEEDAAEIQKQITLDLRKFIEKGTLTQDKSNHYPTPIQSTEDQQHRTLLEKLWYTITFNLRFLFQSILFLWLILLSILSKKSAFFKNKAITSRKKIATLCRNIDGNIKEKISPSINSIDLIEISFRNLWVKKTRTYITIVGMAVGIGFIVFLLSLGYGLERLVISEITRIEDMKQVDITPTISSSVRLDSDSVKKIEAINGVENIMPIYNIAARVQYNQSSTDVVVYGVQPEYIKESPINISTGEIFSDENIGVVVNTDFLTTISTSQNDILDEEISIDFVLSEITKEKEVSEDQTEEVGIEEEEIVQQEEEEVENTKQYKITGVVEDRNPAVIYVPLSEIEKFEIGEYSQLRITIENEELIPDIRRQIEVLGFSTSSVMDTVSEVESLFSLAKLGLLIFGAIALFVAILGMFNTLTVSLLERTREVGLMKTIGMNSDEIRSLFINESMIMGITGGSLGVILGMILGFLLSLALSVLSLARGGEYIAVTFLPLGLILGIIVSGTFVGYLTGLYPSKRAVKMAPLDALRYE